MMKARSQGDAPGSLEGTLASFYRSPMPEPEFIARLERDLLALGTPEDTPLKPGGSLWQRLPVPAQAFVWGVAALLLIFLLSWIFNYTIPQPIPGTLETVTITTSPSQMATPSPSSTPSPTPKISPTPREALFYTVKEGDTLISISRETGVPIEILAELNDFERDDVLWIGRRLVLGFTDKDLVDPFLNSATPVTPAPSAEPLTVTSSSDEIRQQLLNSSRLWHTLWADALTTTSSKGEEHIEREQVWLSPPGNSRWLTGQSGGDPSLLWITNGGVSTQINLPTGDRLELDSGTLLPSQLHQLIFPTDFAVRGGTFRPLNTARVAGRQVIVVDWTNDDGQLIDRFWVDTQTGVILHWKHFPVEYPDASGRVIPSEIVITSIAFDVDMPGGVFFPHASPQQGFSPDYHTP